MLLITQYVNNSWSVHIALWVLGFEVVEHRPLYTNQWKTVSLIGISWGHSMKHFAFSRMKEKSLKATNLPSLAEHKYEHSLGACLSPASTLRAPSDPIVSWGTLISNSCAPLISFLKSLGFLPANTNSMYLQPPCFALVQRMASSNRKALISAKASTSSLWSYIALIDEFTKMLIARNT